MTKFEIQSEVSAVRAQLDELYNGVGSLDASDLKAGIDACSDMLRNLEEEIDGG